MMHISTQRIIEHLAARHGTSPEQLRRDMEAALQAGQRSPSPQVRAHWACLGENSIEALLPHLAILAVLRSTGKRDKHSQTSPRRP